MDESDKTPPKRKAGRPRIEEPRTLRGVRMTDQEWEMFQAMGGAAWLRKVLASLGPGLAPLAPPKGDAPQLGVSAPEGESTD